MAADITEEFQIDLTTIAEAVSTANSSVEYDISFNNLGFFINNSPDVPMKRQTANFRKDQNDNSAEPGEQSLSGWWLRSQSSFHLGCGINFYEPAQDDKLRFRFADSQGVDVWTQGQVSLLHDVTTGHFITGTTPTRLQSISWSGNDGVLMLDEWDVDKIDGSGNVTHFINYNAGTDEKVFAICNDGVNAYWATNDTVTGTNYMHLYKKALTGTDATAETLFYKNDTAAVSNAVMEYVKERVILCKNEHIYELATNGTSATNLPSPVYTHRSTTVTYTDITASGSDIYVSLYDGLNSSILRLTMTDVGLVKALSGAIVAAEMPRGELIHSIKYYMGYILIGTSFGVRVAQVLDNGGLVYGPLLFTTSQPVYQFAFDDSFAWCASGVGSTTGLIRIDLSQQIETLRFAWANDLMKDGVTVQTTGVAFIGDTDKLAFTGAGNYIYVENSNLRSTGYLTTGKIRYNTLERKIFKYITDRATYTTNSTLDIKYAGSDGVWNDVSSKVKVNGNSDSLIDESAIEWLQFKFTLGRDTSTTTTGTTLYGYQIKALPATPRQRLIQYPLFNFDAETDRFNNRHGYDGMANEKLLAVEALESTGDVITVTDTRSGETYSGLIEEVSYISTTPPDRRFSGVGGQLLVTVRKI